MNKTKKVERARNLLLSIMPATDPHVKETCERFGISRPYAQAAADELNVYKRNGVWLCDDENVMKRFFEIYNSKEFNREVDRRRRAARSS